MKKTQHDYEEIMIGILDDRKSITIADFIDILEKRDDQWNDQQIVKNIVSNRNNGPSPFTNGKLKYDSKSGQITKVK